MNHKKLVRSKWSLQLKWKNCFNVISFPEGINVEDEEGFFEEKDLSSFCDTFVGKLPTSNDHSKIPGYLNRLPEANPLLDVRIRIEPTPEEKILKTP